MDIIKIIGTGFIALIITVILKQYKPEYAIYVSIIAGIIILTLVFGKLSGIIEMLKNLANKANVNNQFLLILIKITGIAFLTEYAESICKDSGETAIASKIDMRRQDNNYCNFCAYYFCINGNYIKNTSMKGEYK